MKECNEHNDIEVPMDDLLNLMADIVKHSIGKTYAQVLSCIVYHSFKKGVISERKRQGIIERGLKNGH